MTTETQLLREALTKILQDATGMREAVSIAKDALSTQPARGEAVSLPEFDALDDEVIDNACTAGSLYRVDLMRAWESIRAQIGTTPPTPPVQPTTDGAALEALRAVKRTLANRRLHGASTLQDYRTTCFNAELTCEEALTAAQAEGGK